MMLIILRDPSFPISLHIQQCLHIFLFSIFLDSEVVVRVAAKQEQVCSLMMIVRLTTYAHQLSLVEQQNEFVIERGSRAGVYDPECNQISS
jgi:hypothetical protein